MLLINPPVVKPLEPPAGIATYVYLIFGTPYESLNEARATMRFTAAHADEIGYLNLALFNMPVTESGGGGFGGGGDLSLYIDFKHPRGWGRREVRRFLEDEFKRHPAIAPIVRRTPPVFTSNHAPFFSMHRQPLLHKLEY